jgi:serine/threonine protein kinase
VDLSGPLPVPRVIHFLRQACSSLGEAHQMGLVHRDIKPSNLFACRLGLSLDVVKVLDFGLVTELKPTVSSVTMADVPVGTPAFMAPEQLGGDGPMDARTDLYGLGSVAFWMLTGRLVFEAAALHTLLAQLVTKPAPSPSAVRGEAIPPALEALVLRCLAKEPDDRPGTAEEMLEVLEPLAATYPWTAADAMGWWEKHQPAAGKVPAAG